MTDSNKPIAVARLGAGYIPDYHYVALRLLPNVEVRAICDLNQRLAEQYAQRKEIPNIYSDLGEMLSKLDFCPFELLTSVRELGNRIVYGEMAVKYTR
jgi:predicted dehydrogenase